MTLPTKLLAMTGRALALGCAVAFALAGADAQAQKYPSGPVELVVPWAPGGGTDRSMRIFAPYLAKTLGVPVNIVNIEGGGGWVAWAQMAAWDAEKDDHKVGVVNLPHVYAYLDPKMGRKETVDNFNMITGHSFDPCTWMVRKNDKRFSNLKEFIDYVTKHPGEIVVSTTAVGSDDYQGLAYAEAKIKDFKVGKVYANGDAKKVQELLGEHTDALAGNIAYFMPYFKDEQFVPLAVLSKERSPFLPDVPTFKEVTGVENICFSGRTIVAAPGLAKEKYDVLAKAIDEAMDDPEYKKKELDGSNEIWKVKGKDLADFVKETEATVKEVEYWNQVK